MAKKVTTAVLLLFVLISVGYVIYDRGRQAGRSEKVDGQEQAKPGDGTAGTGEDLEPGVKAVTAYYFFMKPRCATCNKLESYAKEAIEQGFPELAKAGHVKFVAVNCDEPENKHFLTDYMLETKALVLVAREKGMPDDWRNLKEIWEHVGQKPIYLSYVRNEVKALLKTDAAQ
jgi:hypothetical protein